MFRRHHAFGASPAFPSSPDPFPVVRVQVVCDRFALVEKSQAFFIQSVTEVEVFIVEDEIFIESTCVEEEVSFDGDVARIEPSPSGVLTLYRLEVELGPRPIEPSMKVVTGDLGMPIDVAEDGDVWLGVGSMSGEVKGHERACWDHVVAEEQEERPLGGARAEVAC